MQDDLPAFIAASESIQPYAAVNRVLLALNTLHIHGILILNPTEGSQRHRAVMHNPHTVVAMAG